jgi:hypothetical protein
MSKNRPNQPPSFERDPSGPPSLRRAPGERIRHLSAPARLFLSLLIAWHVTAVFLAPLSVPPSSDLVVDVAQKSFMQKYLDALFINHGYSFFAPDPGPGHIMRYEVLDERGNVIRKGEFPDRREQWPRLRYHRYFMLAEQSELPTPDEKVRDEWQRRYMAAYARQLLRQYDGQSARVQCVIHYPLYREDALNGMELTDPRTYETKLEVTQTRRDLPRDTPDQTSAWPGSPPSIARGWRGDTR